MQPVQRFQYRPLDTAQQEFRLLTVRKTDAGLEVGLEHHDLALAADTDYYALSYTWGAELPLHEITVNSKPFSIRKNLYDFLELYSDRLGSELLWVDQICIDQQSVAERNHQVMLMAEIYRRASAVIIWLGVDEYGGMAAQSIQDNRYWDFCDDLATRIGARQSFYHNSYWKRLWVIQEIALAARCVVWHGGATLEWTTFKAFCLERHDDGIPNFLQWLLKYSSTKRSFEPPTPCEIVINCSQNECMDPRDRFYGLLGVLSGTEWALVDRSFIDYRKPIQEIYLDAIMLLADMSHPEDDLHGAAFALANNMGLLHSTDYCLDMDGLDKAIREYTRTARGKGAGPPPAKQQPQQQALVTSQHDRWNVLRKATEETFRPFFLAKDRAPEVFSIKWGRGRYNTIRFGAFGGPLDHERGLMDANANARQRSITPWGLFRQFVGW